MSQNQNNDMNHLSEEELEVDEIEETVEKVKQTYLDQFNELKEMFTRLETLTNEKVKLLDKDIKDFTSYFKKDSKDIEQYFKKVEKVLKVESAKTVKVRKTGNSGKGGFNEPKLVPRRLRDYLGIEEGTLMTRPSVTKLLNSKFIEEGFRANKDGKDKDGNDANGKLIKITNKKSAKILGCKVDFEIKFNELQTFIKNIYLEEKATSVAALAV